MRISPLVAALLAATALPALAGNVIPTDSTSTCTIDDATFDSWFASGSAAANGAVNMPDSFTHDFNVPCDFYTWSMQMFLHLTSPTGTNTYVVNDSNFFNALDDGTYGPNNFTAFTLVRNAPGTPSSFALRTRKTPDIGQAGGGETLISQATDVVYYGIHVNDVYAGFADAQSKYPDLFQFDFTPSNPDYAASIDNFPVTDDEAAAVLIYGILSGYVLAPGAMQTQAKELMIEILGLDGSATLDDMAAAGEDFVAAAAKAAEMMGDGAVLPTPIELKTSWIVADTAVAGDYVTIEAEVPTFDDRSNPASWPLDVNGSGETVLTRKTLVMTGMHVVAPVKDNPEMAWMSFEHLSNNPLADYVYTNASGNVTVPYGGSGTWNFAPSTSDQPTDVTSTAKAGAEGAIVTDHGATAIAPITVALMNPWGLQNATQNPSPDSDDLSNANDVIALNASVLAKLDALGDTRASYFQIGGLWTHGGGMPAGGDYDKQVGGLYLANSTMETFHQANAQSQERFKPQNCFDCHGVSTPSTTPGTGISHAFDGIVYRITNPD